MINRLTKTFLLLVLAVFLTSCTDYGYDHPKLMAEIDYDAVYINQDKTSDYTQILLRMSLKNYQGDILKFGLNTPEKHQERLHYFIQEFKNDISLVSNQDTINCIDAHFERLHMDLPYRNFILTFKQDNFESNNHIMINDFNYSNQILKLSIQENHED